MIVTSAWSTRLINGVIDLLALNLCSTPINYDLPFFSAIKYYFFSYFEKEMEGNIPSIFIKKYFSFPLLHFL